MQLRTVGAGDAQGDVATGREGLGGQTVEGEVGGSAGGGGEEDGADLALVDPAYELGGGVVKPHARREVEAEGPDEIRRGRDCDRLSGELDAAAGGQIEVKTHAGLGGERAQAFVVVYEYKAGVAVGARGPARGGDVFAGGWALGGEMRGQAGEARSVVADE